MSRTNPFKKKLRAAKITTLIYGEGMAEEIFLKHLRKLYAKNSGVAVTIRRGKGGAADAIALEALRFPGNFNRRLVLLDQDKSDKEMKKARLQATTHGIILIENKPCLEALLMSILEKKGNFENKTSGECKKIFEKKYIDSKRRAELQEYEKVFSRSILDARRKSIPALNEIILAITNCS